MDPVKINYEVQYRKYILNTNAYNSKLFLYNILNN